MKKKLFAISLLLLASTGYAASTNIHFYAQNKYYKEGVIEAEIESDISQLKELAESSDGVRNAPIHIAVMQKNIGAIKEISKSRDFIDVNNSYDQTALMMALKMGNIEIVNILIENGASTSGKDAQGNSVDAYAKVGGINLNAIEKKIRGDNIEEEVAQENVDNSLEEMNYQQMGAESGVEIQRLNRVEENLEDIVNLITNHENVIQDFQSNKDTVKVDLEKANEYIEKLKINVKRQAQVLIPIIKDNKYKIAAIDQQGKRINDKITELTEKISQINQLKKEVLEKIKDVEKMGKDLDKTKESLIEPELELETILNLESQKDNQESKIIKIDFNDVNQEKNDISAERIAMVEYDNSKTIEELMPMIKSIAQISLLILAILIALYFKRKSKKKADDNNDDDDDDDDETTSKESSKMHKSLDEIEIEDGISSYSEDDIFDDFENSDEKDIFEDDDEDVFKK